MSETFRASSSQYQEIAKFARESANDGTEDLQALEVSRSGELVKMHVMDTLNRSRNQVQFDNQKFLEKDKEFTGRGHLKAQTIHTHPDNLAPSDADKKVFEQRGGPNLIPMINKNREAIIANFGAKGKLTTQYIDGQAADLVAVAQDGSTRIIEKSSSEAAQYGIAA